MSDQKVSALTELSIPTLDDLIYFVDSASPPVSYKMTLARLLGNAFPSTCEGRLTLAPGFPIYEPQALTPSATNTATEVVTFAAAHGWVTGTRLTIAATIAGLTAGTLYYFNALSTTTGAFYTTLTNAIADTSRVDLTANVTNLLIPSGVEGKTMYFSPFNGSNVALYDGTRWKMFAFTELSLALGTLTTSIGYDVFIYDNSGVPTLEFLAWTSATARATALVRQDGVWSKSGALTRRYVGSFYTNTTTSTTDDSGGIISQVGGRRFVYNSVNKRRTFGRVRDNTASWNYSTATWRQANAAAGNMNEFFQGLQEDHVDAKLQATHSGSASSAEGSSAMGLDSITVPDIWSTIGINTMAAASGLKELPSRLTRTVPIGYHYVSWMERGNGTTTGTYYGWDSSNNNRLTGLICETFQ